MNRRAFSTALVAAISFFSTRGRAAQTVEVDIIQSSSRFDPDTVQVGVGDTVSWTNSGYVTHTVTCDPKVSKTCVLPTGSQPFDSGDLGEDKVFTHVFTAPGTYKYVCKYHEAMGMIGTVVVS